MITHHNLISQMLLLTVCELVTPTHDSSARFLCKLLYSTTKLFVVLSGGTVQGIRQWAW